MVLRWRHFTASEEENLQALHMIFLLTGLLTNFIKLFLINFVTRNIGLPEMFAIIFYPEDFLKTFFNYIFSEFTGWMIPMK